MISIIKKTLLLVFILTPQLTFAQLGEPRSNIAIGVNSGVNFNAMFFNPTISQKRLITPSAGLSARITSEKYFNLLCALQIELNYSRLGWREDVLDQYSMPLPDKYKRCMDYLQLPFLARLSWGKELNGPMIYLIAGPQIGFCFNEMEKKSETWTEVNGVPSRPNGMYEQYGKPIDRKFDYGITAGLGLELNTKIGHFMIDGRYYFGLSDIFDNGKKDLFARSAHGTIIAKVSYMFDIKK
jgi:hypothetical protein